MKIKLIALDLDDTLLMPNLTIHDDNIEAISHALNAGIVVILASGRTIQSMAPYAKLVGMFGRAFEMICVNGAEVRDVDSGAILKQTALNKDDCIDVAEALASYGLPVQAYDDNGIITTKLNKWTEMDCKLTGLSYRLVDKPSDLADVPRSKILSAGEPSEIARIESLMQKQFADRVDFVISKPYFLEALPAGVDKGDALSWVASRRGIKQSEVMAIGDAGNDIGMIKWAGYGCSPLDARDSVKAVSKYISTKNHDEAAVAELIRRLAL